MQRPFLTPSRKEENRYLAYEAAKRAWAAQHPGASCQEYAKAMREIAARLGI